MIGVGWALQIAGFLRAGAFAHDAGIAPAVYVIVPLATVFAGACGLALHRASTDLPEVPIAALVLATGGVAGLTVGFVWWPPDGVMMAGRTGLAIAAAALPVLLPTLRAMARVDQAGKWAIAGCMVAVTTPLTLPRWNPYPTSHDPGSVLGIVAGSIGVLVALIAHATVARAPVQSMPADSPYRTGTFELPNIPSSARLALGCATGAVLAVLAAFALW